MRDSSSELVYISSGQETIGVLLSSQSYGLAGGCVPSSLGHTGCLCLSPFNLIHMVINQLMTSWCLGMTLITPRWPHLKWFLYLPSLLMDFPREIPLCPSILRQPQSRRFHLDILALHLHFCRLFSISSKREAFFQRTAWEMARIVQRLSSNVYQGKWVFFCCWCQKKTQQFQPGWKCLHFSYLE